MMDCVALHVRLVAAEAHAAEDHRNIERQLRLIADLERDARYSLQAKQRLASLEEVQAPQLDTLATIAERLEKLS
jgi:phage host-nuclease inhibitor protein Gam